MHQLTMDIVNSKHTRGCEIGPVQYYWNIRNVHNLIESHGTQFIFGIAGTD